jgi:hypothetical protein
MLRLRVWSDRAAIPEAAHAPHWIDVPDIPRPRMPSMIASRDAFAAL